MKEKIICVFNKIEVGGEKMSINLAVLLILTVFVVGLSALMIVIFYKEEKRRKQLLQEEEKALNAGKDTSKHEQSNM